MRLITKLYDFEKVLPQISPFSKTQLQVLLLPTALWVIALLLLLLDAPTLGRGLTVVVVVVLVDVWVEIGGRVMVGNCSGGCCCCSCGWGCCCWKTFWKWMVGAELLLLLFNLLIRLAAWRAVGGPGAVWNLCGVTTSTRVFRAATTWPEAVIIGRLVGVSELRLMVAGNDLTAEMGRAFMPLIWKWKFCGMHKKRFWVDLHIQNLRASNWLFLLEM